MLLITLMSCFRDVQGPGSTHKHQSIVERFNWTLAERLFRIQDAIEFITEIEDTKWVENLQDIVDDLNNSITRLIGMKPATETGDSYTTG